jgi:hypothetical protein
MKQLTVFVGICLIVAGLFTLAIGHAMMPQPEELADLWPYDQEQQPPYPEPEEDGTWDWEGWEGGEGEMDGRGTQPSDGDGNGSYDPDYVPPEGTQYPLVTILGLEVTTYDIIGLLLVLVGMILLLTEGNI